MQVALNGVLLCVTISDVCCTTGEDGVVAGDVAVIVVVVFFGGITCAGVLSAREVDKFNGKAGSCIVSAVIFGIFDRRGFLD